jgi:hypothetical protein
MQVDYHTTIAPDSQTWMTTQQRSSRVCLYISEGSQHFSLDFLTWHLPVLEELVKQLRQVRQQEVIQLREQLDAQLSQLEISSETDIPSSQSNNNLMPSYTSEF